MPSAWPPLIRLQKRHTAGTRSPKRVRARSQAAPAPRAQLPRRCAQHDGDWIQLYRHGHQCRCQGRGAELKAAPPLARRRHRHPQSVGHAPHPLPTTMPSASGWPITSTWSNRRSSRKSGNSACERRHLEHRPRRIHRARCPGRAPSASSHSTHRAAAAHTLDLGMHARPPRSAAPARGRPTHPAGTAIRWTQGGSAPYQPSRSVRTARAPLLLVVEPPG